MMLAVIALLHVASPPGVMVHAHSVTEPSMLSIAPSGDCCTGATGTATSCSVCTLYAVMTPINGEWPQRGTALAAPHEVQPPQRFSSPPFRPPILS